jgi:hypothetical protein
MELGAIFLTFALTLLAAGFIARPFFERRKIGVVSAEEHELSSLLAERDRLITALQELDFDNTLGKIPAEDYPSQRAALMQKAADAIRRLDELQPRRISGKDAESRIEAVIASRRADAAINQQAPEAVSDDDLEALISARRSERKEKSGGFCPKCGKPVLRTDKFCPSCGKSIR